MTNYLLSTALGRLKILGWLEGASLLVLVFVAVPAKYVFDHPALVKMIGPVHGILFLLFVFHTIAAGIEQGWKFRKTTWKVLLACLIPFGTFYINTKVLSKQTTVL